MANRMYSVASTIAVIKQLGDYIIIILKVKTFALYHKLKSGKPECFLI